MLDQLPPAAPPAPTIVVAAEALTDPAAERGYSVSTLGRSSLRNAPAGQLEEVLKQVPGLQLFRRSDARSGHPTSQGVTLRALGGNASSRALLVLDGVPQADPFGGWVNWPAYDPAAIARVRVIRGGGSVAHGPGAVAGVIDMVSGAESGLAAAGELGSRGSREGRVHFAGALASGTLSLSGRAGSGEGFIPITAETRGPADETAQYAHTNLRALLVMPLTGIVDAQASASAFTDRRTRGLAFTGNDTDGTDASLRLIGRGALQWSATGYAQWRELQSSFASVSAGRAAASRVSLQDKVPSHAFGASVEVRPIMRNGLEVRVGADVRRTAGESRELFSYVSGEPRRRRVAGGKSVAGGLFGELTADLGTLMLSGGVRVDRWTISKGQLAERLLATGAPLRDESYPSRSGWRPTARTAAVLDLSRGWSLRSAAYLGWRLPTLNELFRPFRAGPDATAANAMLNPETLAGVEIGGKYERNGATVSITAFANRLSGAIANVTLGDGPGVFPGVGFVPAGGEYRQRRNLGAVRVQGVEATAELRRGAWSVRGGASLVDPVVKSGGPAAGLDGLRPAQTPSFVVAGAVAWDDGARAVSLNVRHSGSQFEDDLNQRLLPSARTVDAFAAWPLARRLQLALRGENLLDERVVAGIGNDGSVERATPRMLWLGLRLGPGR